MMIGYKSCDDNSRQITTLPHSVRIFQEKRGNLGSVWIVGSGCEIGGGRMDGGEERSLVSVSVTKIFGWTESWPRVSRA